MFKKAFSVWIERIKYIFDNGTDLQKLILTFVLVLVIVYSVFVPVWLYLQITGG
jgi:hypothetical protein